MRVLVVLITVLLPACAGAQGGGKPQVVATVYPLAWLAEQVVRDADVTLIVAGGQDAHDADISPQQRAQLDNADVVAYLGPIGYQPQLEATIGSLDVASVSVAAELGENAFLTIEGGGLDPHFWFDARLLADVAPALAQAASGGDPAKAKVYEENAERVSAQLDALADEVDAMLDRCRFDEVIVSHEAYAYLLEPHGLTQHGVSPAGGRDQASPQRIAELVNEITSQQIPSVLTEPVEGRTDAEAVAREAGVELIDIYSLDIVDDEQLAKGFPQLLREQAQSVAQAAACEGRS